MHYSNQADKLREAKALIENPKHWHQSSLYKDAAGNPVLRIDEAASYCAIGAAIKTEANLKILSDCADPKSVSQINDDAGHSAVMDLYNTAIKVADRQHKVELVKRKLAWL